MSFFDISVVAGLFIVLFASALAVVGSKYQSRSLFIAIQAHEVRLDKYELDWGRLQLELMTLTRESNLEREAKERLGLKLPEREKIIYLKP